MAATSQMKTRLSNTNLRRNEVKGVDLPNYSQPLYFLMPLKARPQNLFTNYWKVMLFMQ